MKNGPISFSSEVINFSNIPISYNRHSALVTVENLSKSNFYFTIKHNEPDLFLLNNNTCNIAEDQLCSNFNIFYSHKYADHFIIEANGKIRLICVLVPGEEEREIDSTFILSAYSYKIHNEEEEYNPSEHLPLKTFELKVKAKVFIPTVLINPSGLILDDCCKDHTSTFKISIQNTSPIAMTYLIYPYSGLIIDDLPTIKKLVLNPNENCVLKAKYTPEKVGQFENTIFIEVPESCVKSFQYFLMSLVSPYSTPENFPEIEPSFINFGDILYGSTSEELITLTNTSYANYSVYATCYVDNNEFHPVMFKTAQKASLEKHIRVILGGNSSTSFFVVQSSNYDDILGPSLVSKKSIVILEVKNLENDTTFFRKVVCKVRICKSIVTSSVDAINFGDIFMSTKQHSGYIVFTNSSPLPTTIQLSTNTKYLQLQANTIDLQPDTRFKIAFTIYLHKIKNKFNGTIKMVNINNQYNTIEIPVTASILSATDYSRQSSYFSISINSKTVKYIDLKHQSVGFPALKQFTIKNISNGPITLTFSSTNDKSIKVYTEKKTVFLRSNSSSSFASASANDNSSSLQVSGYASIKDLAVIMENNSEFFSNMFSINERKTDVIVNHFLWQLSQLENILVESMDELKFDPFTIQIGDKVNFYLVVTPDDFEVNYPQTTVHEKLNIKMTTTDDTVINHTLPITYIVSKSSINISVSNINYGEIHSKTVKEHALYIYNYSALPLLFRFVNNLEAVTILNSEYGILPPYKGKEIPVKFVAPDFDFNKSVSICNALNSFDSDKKVNFKSTLLRKYNFSISPDILDFGVIKFGSSKKKSVVFIPSDDNNHLFRFHNNPSLGGSVLKPMISFKLIEIRERKSSVEIQQLEKLNRKLLILQRKGKSEQANKIKSKIIDILHGNPEWSRFHSKYIENISKYIDRFYLNTAPFKEYILEIELIPSLTHASDTIDYTVSGSISVYIDSNSAEKKEISYKARVNPYKLREQNISNSNSSPIQISPEEFNLSNINVNSIHSEMITLHNTSDSPVSFWLSYVRSSEQSAFINFSLTEGVLESKGSTKVSIDIIPTVSGRMELTITVTTPTSSKSILVKFEAIYKKVIQIAFQKQDQNSIDFGHIGVVSLRNIEHKANFTITNVSSKKLYLLLTNSQKEHLILYVKDPSDPIKSSQTLIGNSKMTFYVLFRPEIEYNEFRKYIPFVLKDSICIHAFEDENDASIMNYEFSNCIFKHEIPVFGVVGRVGLNFSEKFIDFGTVTIGSTNETTFQIWNRSSKVPLDVSIYSRKITILHPKNQITLQGSKEYKQDVNIRFTPTENGLNHYKIEFRAKILKCSLDVYAFVDRRELEIEGLPRNKKNTYQIDLGVIFVSNGVPIISNVTVNIKNITHYSIGNLYIPEFNKYFSISKNETSAHDFQIPFGDYTVEDKKHYNSRIHIMRAERAVQIIDVVGRFIVSNFVIVPSILDMGTFITSETSFENTLKFQVQNTTMGDIYVNLITTDSLFNFPRSIGPIPGYSSLEVTVPFDKQKFKDHETGVINSSVTYQNAFNKSNTQSLEITLNIAHSFLSFVEQPLEGGIYELFGFNEVTTGDDVVYESSLYISAKNNTTSDLITNINITNIDESYAKTEVHQSNSIVNTLHFQELESLDIRFKVTLGRNARPSSDRVTISTITFSSPLYSEYKLFIVYQPSATQPVPPPPQITNIQTQSVNIN